VASPERPSQVRNKLNESPTLYAHRGATVELPENTLEAFRLAIELGADAIETDAHMTRDGRIVLSHDASGARMAGVPRAIRDATYGEIAAWDVGASFVARDGRRGTLTPYRVPTLDEALAALPGVVFNVDAKQVVPDMIPALLRTIRVAGAEGRVRIASFSARNLGRVRQAGYEGQTGVAPAELVALMLAPRSIARRLRRGDAAQVPMRASGITFASQRAIDRLHGLGLRVDFWTIDDPDDARRLLAMGADGIMTDDIRRIAGALRPRAPL
jgi:glycerophosphoryl diester phosphodiesterase